MSDDLEVAGGIGGMDRREFIRKGAIVGGMAGMVWAAPAISSIGRPAFAGTPMGDGISNFAFIVNNDSDARFKYEAGEESLEGEQALMPCVGSLPQDPYIEEWCAAENGDNQATVTTQTVTIGGEAYVEYTITATPTYTLGWLIVMEAGECYFRDLPAGTTQFSFSRPDIFVAPWQHYVMSTVQQCSQLGL